MNSVAQSLTRPSELLSLVNFKLLGGERRLFPPNDLSEETASMKRCYHYLRLTSRSFAAVIQALDPSVRPSICIFYLVLRGLDTVEDDMSIRANVKKDLLYNFHEKLYQPGWTFKGNSPTEKDRPLMLEFDVVIKEFLALETKFNSVIADICKKMGAGMVKFMRKEVVTVEDYNLYCHFVAGLVGIGLSQLFAASGLEDESVGKSSDLANSMGLFLQKTNIIRDYKEDLDDGRTWWPREIWSQYATELGDLATKEHRAKGVACINHLVANALSHVPDVFEYMGQLHNQTIFNFCAIPQVMAIATLSLCYNNAGVLAKNVKIRKGEAVQMMMQASDMPNLYSIFARYAREILKKAPADDDKTREAASHVLALVAKLDGQPSLATTEAAAAARTRGGDSSFLTTALPYVAVGAAGAALVYMALKRRV